MDRMFNDQNITIKEGKELNVNGTLKIGGVAIGAAEFKTLIKGLATDLTDPDSIWAKIGAEFNYLDVTAGMATASKALVLDANSRIDKFAITEAVVVDASAGGVAQTTNLTLVPAGSILLNVTAVVTEAFDGDATQTFEIGVSGNADAYIDAVDFDPAGAVNTYASSLNGTTNDIVAPQWLPTATQLIATWTNTASATKGIVTVYTTYVKI